MDFSPVANGTAVTQYLCRRFPIWRFCCVFREEIQCFIDGMHGPIYLPDNDNQPYYRPYFRGHSTTTTPYPISDQLKNSSAEKLDWWVRTVLLPTAMLLIAICFILGVILVVKSYMMTSIKQNLATAIRRRRRTGHAPDNQYIAPAEMRASRPCSDRKSFPPPEVLLAARERASQIYTV